MANVSTEEKLDGTISNDPKMENDMISMMYSKSGTPLSSRDETVNVMNALMGTDWSRNGTRTDRQQQLKNGRVQRPPIRNLHGNGPLILSDIPSSALKTKENGKEEDRIVVGIDEAGRGSVLGPMVYGAAFWNLSKESTIPKGFNDSKQLTSAIRYKLLKETVEQSEHVGFAARILHASEISRNMLRKQPNKYNLNEMSHDAAIDMIRSILQAGVDIDACYIDTVGVAAHYKRKLERIFPQIHFVVESKADSKYAPCSAASIVAKVVRDQVIENWQFSEPHFNQDNAAVSAALDDDNNSVDATTTTTTTIESTSHKKSNTNVSNSQNSKVPELKDFGSGYPSDPKCVKWMEKNLQDPVFAYPDLVRFSWGTTKKSLEQAVSVEFEADKDEEDETTKQQAAMVLRQQQQMNLFLGRKPVTKKRKRRLPYFEKNKLQVVPTLF